MKIAFFAVLASAVLTRECGMSLDECATFCGPRPIKSFTMNGNVDKNGNVAICECEDYTPCVIVPGKVER